MGLETTSGALDLPAGAGLQKATRLAPLAAFGLPSLLTTSKSIFTTVPTPTFVFEHDILPLLHLWRASEPVPTINGAITAYIYSTPSATSTSTYPHPRSTSKRSQSFSARATRPSPLRYGTHEPEAGHYPVSEDGRLGGRHSRERVHLPRRASYKTSDHGEPLILSFRIFRPVL